MLRMHPAVILFLIKQEKIETIFIQYKTIITIIWYKFKMLIIIENYFKVAEKAHETIRSNNRKIKMRNIKELFRLEIKMHLAK